MEKTSCNKRTTKRPTKIQINTLIDYMATHPTFASLQRWKSVKCPVGHRRQLERLVQTLNCLGPKRTAGQWLTTWRDLKRRARLESEEAKQTADQMGNPLKISDISVQTQKILSTFDTDTSFDIEIDDASLEEDLSEIKINIDDSNIHIEESTINIEESNIHIEESNINIEDSKSEDIYEIVITCCLDLVRVHGRPVEMFDDEAFKNIIKLIPLTEKQRNSLDSKTMKLVLGYPSNINNKNGNDRVQEMATIEIIPENPNAELSSNNDKLKLKDTASLTKVFSSKKCTCPTNDSTSNEHAYNCNIQLQEPCWKFFSVTLDRAECNLCKKVMLWSNISFLEQHLHFKHPEIQFQDKNNKEQPISVKCYVSPTQSTTDMDGEHLEDFDDNKNTNPNDLYTPMESYSNDDAMELSDIKFKAIENFGVYVVSLLKIIPEKKSAKLQSLIVQKLLQEQMDAC